MITVTGEALIDLVIDGDGSARPRPGGGPFNTARTIGRLGLAPAFLGRLSRDDFGHQLRARLEQDGVTLAVPQPADAPTTLAVVDIDAAGAPRYRFYLAGTSAGALEHPLLEAALPAGMTALHAGTLALIMEPIATSIERLITTGLPAGTLVMIDPNCRPGAITDRSAYRARLDRILRRADVVKVSIEDLSYLYPGAAARYAEGTDEHGDPIDVVDRYSDRLTSLAKRQRTDPGAFITNRDLFGNLAGNERFMTAFKSALTSLHQYGARATLASLAGS